MSYRAQICSDRASILLETAICLPFYFVLLVFLVDLPQIMSHRQSLQGIARLEADIKARNFGDSSMVTESMCKNLFWHNPDQILKIENVGDVKNSTEDSSDEIANEYPTMLNAFFCSDGQIPVPDIEMILPQFLGDHPQISYGIQIGLNLVIEAFSFAKKYLGALINLFTFGSISTFIDNIFFTDVFYRSSPRIAITTVLPPEFYAIVMGFNIDQKMYVHCPYDCWQPSGNTAQNPGQTLFGKIGDKINDLVGWIKNLIPKPDFNLDT